MYEPIIAKPSYIVKYYLKTTLLLFPFKSIYYLSPNRKNKKTVVKNNGFGLGNSPVIKINGITRKGQL